MEEQKIDKRSKEYRDSLLAADLTNVTMVSSAPVEKLISSGIQLSDVHFQSAVNNADKVPENYFSSKSDRPSRRVEAWLCAGGTIVIFRQKGKYFFTPSANCQFGNFS